MASTYGVPEIHSKIVGNSTKSTSDAAQEFSLDYKDYQNASKFYYGIRIANGSVGGSGTTDTGVYALLVGDKGATAKLYILSYFDIIKGGTYEDLLVETDADLGNIKVVIFGNEKNWFLPTNDQWYVNYSVIYHFTATTATETKFPCYHWIGDDEVISTTSATKLLRDVKDDEILLKQREFELHERRQKYQWQIFSDVGVPSAIDDTRDDIPADEEFSRVKNIDFTWNGVQALARIKLTGVFTDVNDLSDFARFAKTVNPEAAIPLYEAGRWTSDVEFGRQILNGVNPMMVKKCTEIPSKFPVTNNLVQPYLTRGLTLDQEIKAGRVYICDMEIMDGIPAREGCYVLAPIVLLYVNSNDDLVPIAIQIRQGVRKEEKSIPNPIFVPGDNWIDWVLAKIYYQNSQGQLHQALTHYISTHAAMEAYCVATMRYLPDAHPINKLLRPHFRFTIAINSRARASLISEGGSIDKAFGFGGQGKVEVFKRASEFYTVDFTNIKKSIQERGLESVPKFYYRDDGLKLWDHIESFVSSIIDEFYKSDSEVKNDEEVKKWSEDIYTNGFPKYKGALQGRGFPKNILTKNNLIEQCTRIIFTGSCQHAAVNFGQYVIYSYVPNAPLAIRQPPPRKKGESTYHTLIKTLPDEATTIICTTITYALSQYSPDEILLGDYPAERFLEPGAVTSISAFKAKLTEYGEEVKLRNAALDIPYIHMLPEKVPNSITI